jgi:hypothetical protein
MQQTRYRNVAGQLDQLGLQDRVELGQAGREAVYSDQRPSCRPQSWDSNSYQTPRGCKRTSALADGTQNDTARSAQAVQRVGGGVVGGK